MATSVAQPLATQESRWQRFIGLKWYNRALDFFFHFTAISSEILLAIGVILATVNHFQHGALFASTVSAHGKTLLVDTPIFAVWTWTQAIGFEASAGVVLLMALTANRDNDRVKRDILLVLMAGLALVGTVMLVMSYVEASTGIHESDLPDWYGVTMAIARGVVSVAYVTIGRVKGMRFSGNAIVQPAEVPAVWEKLDEVERSLQVVQSQMIEQVQGVVQSQIHLAMRDIHQVVQGVVQSVVQSELQVMVQSLPAVVHPVVSELPLLVQEQVQMVVSEQVQPLLQEQVRVLVQSLEDGQLQQLTERMQEVYSTFDDFKKEMRTTITEVRTVTQTERKVNHLPSEHRATRTSSLPTKSEPLRLVQGSAKAIESEPGDASVEQRVRGFILAQRELGKVPSLNEIVNQCKCSKNTAIRYRRELLGDEEDIMVAPVSEVVAQ